MVLRIFFRFTGWTYRSLSAKADAAESKNAPKKPKPIESVETKRFTIPPEYRHIYPEFLPDPNIDWRNSIREKLERSDMIDRRYYSMHTRTQSDTVKSIFLSTIFRGHIDIPEFYVGSIMAVTSSDPHSIGKTTRFVGICTNREGCGLRARFELRNVIDHQGIEVQYEMYDPTIQKIEVLRLEKRLDDKLMYLCDALPEYSTFDVNMEAEVHPEGEPVPVNPLKVQMKPRPWKQRWERYKLQGVSNIEEMCPPHVLAKSKLPMFVKDWEKYDLMKEYRRTIPDEEQQSIYSEVYKPLNALHLQRKIQKRKRSFVKPIKKA